MTERKVTAMIKGKKEEIERYLQKDKEWLAQKLYEARDKLQDSRKGDLERRSAIEEARELERVIANMVKVLEKRGFSPSLLEITYSVKGGRECLGCEEYSCEFCDAPVKVKVKTVSFWDYEVEDGTISGILNSFKECKRDVCRVVDRKTGRIIYEKPEEDNAGTEE